MFTISRSVLNTSTYTTTDHTKTAVVVCVHVVHVFENNLSDTFEYVTPIKLKMMINLLIQTHVLYARLNTCTHTHSHMHRIIIRVISFLSNSKSS